MADINKAVLPAINRAKNLICEGTKSLCGDAVTVAAFRRSGIAAKQPNSRHVVWIGMAT
jgi:hypothetical protein